MPDIWVYIDDGSLQCGEAEATAANVVREKLEGLVGQPNVMEQVHRNIPEPVIEQCGTRTGWVYVFHITEQGYNILIHGIRGPEGFLVWDEGKWGPPIVT